MLIWHLKRSKLSTTQIEMQLRGLMIGMDTDGKWWVKEKISVR